LAGLLEKVNPKNRYDTLALREIGLTGSDNIRFSFQESVTSWQLVLDYVGNASQWRSQPKIFGVEKNLWGQNI